MKHEFLEPDTVSDDDFIMRVETEKGPVCMTAKQYDKYMEDKEMTKVEVVVKTTNSDRGTFKMGDILFQARETANKWKLVAKNQTVTIEYEWSKKDFSTFEEWVEELLTNGYERVEE